MILEETSSMYQIHICLQGFRQQNKRKGLLIPNMKIQPGLKAKLLFIFIVCSNKIQNRVMLSGKSNENGEKTIIGQTLKPKKNNFARAAHFFVHFFAVVLHDFNVKLPETSWLHVFSGRKMSYVFLFTFIFTAAHFFVSGLQHFSLSQLTDTTKFSCCYFNKV